MVALRLRRQINLLSARLLRRSGPKRQGDTGKRGGGTLFGFLITVSMIWSLSYLSYKIVESLFAVLPGEQVLKGLTLELAIIALGSLLVMVGSRELARGDWDLEWLATLPVRLKTLLWTRLLERALVNPNGLLMLFPVLFVIGWSERGFEAALPMLLAGIPLLIILGAVHLVLDTGLRVSQSPVRLRNLQAMISIAGVMVMYLAMSPGFATGGSSLIPVWAKVLPNWVEWSPFGLAIRIVRPLPYPFDVSSFAVLLGETMAIAFGAVQWVAYQLRLGIQSGGDRESGRARTRARSGASAVKLAWLSPIQLREFRLLARDRNFLVQTTLLPVIIIGSQFYFNGVDVLPSLATSPARVAIMGFGIAAYALMFSAFQTLNSEGQALWVIFSVPRSMTSILREKAKMWSIVAALYPLALFCVYFAMDGELTLAVASTFATALLGIPIYTAIATSLGVFACDPLAVEIQRRVKPSYLYLFMMLSSYFGFALNLENRWQTASFVILSASLAGALWQKAESRLPYLLDAGASPPASVSLSDGLIAAMLFFVVQAVTLFARHRGETIDGSELFVAFGTAGIVTFLVVRFTFWRIKATGVPRYFGKGAGRAVGFGALMGIVAAVLGTLYLRAAHAFEIFPELRSGAAKEFLREPWFLALAVLAAPIFEEFIFRGLIFGGMTRFRTLWVSTLASAALFAIVHPVASVIPVFGLGVCAAYAYSRSGILLAPVIAHVIYNAAIIFSAALESGSLG